MIQIIFWNKPKYPFETESKKLIVWDFVDFFQLAKWKLLFTGDSLLILPKFQCQKWAFDANFALQGTVGKE